MKKDFSGKSDGQVVLEYLGYFVEYQKPNHFRLMKGCNCNCPKCGKKEDFGHCGYALERQSWEVGVQNILTLEFLLEEADARGWCIEITKYSTAEVFVSRAWIPSLVGTTAFGAKLQGDDVRGNIISSLAQAIKIQAVREEEKS